MNPKHPPGPAMTLGNLRQLGVQRLAIFCLNSECLRGLVCLGTLLNSFAFGESCDASET
jgi:hypothetical protein